MVSRDKNEIFTKKSLIKTFVLMKRVNKHNTFEIEFFLKRRRIWQTGKNKTLQ